MLVTSEHFNAQVPATAKTFVGKSRQQLVRVSASPGDGESLLQRVPAAAIPCIGESRLSTSPGGGESLRRRVPA